MTLELRCSGCGGPMPDLELDDLTRQLASSRGVQLVCAGCSNVATKVAEESGRHFQLAVELVEVTTPPTCSDCSGEGHVGGEPCFSCHGQGFTGNGAREVLMEFRASATAPSLDAAMRPLALEFGEQWQKAELHSHIADSPRS